jgi:hypothetical protein
MTLVEWVGRVVPLFPLTTLLEDAQPAMRLDDPPPFPAEFVAGSGEPAAGSGAPDAG